MKEKEIETNYPNPTSVSSSRYSHEEIDELKGMIRDVSSQVQGLRERIDKYIEVTGVRLPKHDDPEGG